MSVDTLDDYEVFRNTRLPTILDYATTKTISEPRKKVIYTASPYRSTLGEWHILENIRKAEKAAIFIWQHGGVALCPQKNTAFFGGVPGTNDETWLNGDLELLRRSDAVWVVDSYSRSRGVVMEIQFARDHGIPLLYNEQQVIDFINKP